MQLTAEQYQILGEVNAREAAMRAMCTSNPHSRGCITARESLSATWRRFAATNQPAPWPAFAARKSVST